MWAIGIKDMRFAIFTPKDCEVVSKGLYIFHTFYLDIFR